MFWAKAPEWEVEKIVACEVVTKGKPPKQWEQTWYKVRWKGYTESFDTWEPAEHLKNAQEVVDAWDREQAGGTKKRRAR